MRPERADIAVPPLPPGIDWVGASPPAAERITAPGPALIHFFEVGELSGVRTLPYVSTWAERYAPYGLTVLGIHSPRSPLAAETADLAAALERLGVGFPVANDREHRIWHDYGCRGWPSLFLWGRGGALRWFHFGEGEYVATEEAIQGELRGEQDELELPSPLAAIRPVDEPGVEVRRPSEEVFPGGAVDRPWRPEPGEPLEIEYAAGGCWAALGGSGEASASVDGAEPVSFRVESVGMYELAAHHRHGAHEVRLELEPSIGVWSVAFAAGLP